MVPDGGGMGGFAGVMGGGNLRIGQKISDHRRNLRVIAADGMFRLAAPGA